MSDEISSLRERIINLEAAARRLADENISLTAARERLLTVARAAWALTCSVRPSLSPDTELVSEPALTALETALAAAGYDLLEGEFEASWRNKP